MRLQRIELKGFLSHYGHKNAIGKIEPVKIDFCASPLWLIHGSNGSGKSSLFDAITFALYKQHRGGKSNFHELVHDRAENDIAEINLEIELGAQRYLIQRTITRIEKQNVKSSKVWGIVRHWAGFGWKAVPDTENTVEDWVQNNLRMSADTFTSAVVLRQGEADAFLKAKPAARKERLLELLDLKLYKRLGETTKKYCDQWKGELKKITEELGEPISEESLEQQHQKNNQAEATLTIARQSQRAKERELQNAENAQDWNAEIKIQKEKQKTHSVLLAKAGEIESNLRRYLELTNVLPLFESLWSARRSLSVEEEQIKSIEKETTAHKSQLADLALRFQEGKGHNEVIHQQLADLSECVERLQARQHGLAEHLGNIERVESLEAEIQRIKAELEPHRLVLAESDQIERDATRYADLTKAIPQIQKLTDAQADLERDRQALGEKKQSIPTLQETLKFSQTEEAQLLEVLESKRNEYQEIQERFRQCQQQIKNLAEKLEHRSRIAHEQECPTCGSHLDTQEAQERLAQEQTRWQLEVSVLKAGEQALLEKLESEKKAGYAARDTHKIAQDKTRQAEKALNTAEALTGSLEETLRRQQKFVEALYQEVGIWADRLDQLANLQTELESLSNAPVCQTYLEAAKSAQMMAGSKIEVHQNELARLPKFSDEERQKIRCETKETEKAISSLQQQQQDLNQQLKAAGFKQTALESEDHMLQIKLQSTERQLGDLQRRQQQAEQELEQREKLLVLPWSEHLAFEDETALEVLRREKKDLSQIEEEQKQLREAEKQKHEIEGAISTFEKQLAIIPIEHRRPTEEVQAELNLANTIVQQAEQELREEQDKLTDISRKKQLYEKKLIEQNHASEECRHYGKLAEALGSKGLQAKVVQSAQETIKTYANTILGRLSNNTWQVDLQESKDGKELEILARDLSSPGLPVRQFEYLSGGEKFRVAISLAIAIGQAICGGRTVDTLVIDEGFGALDEMNRSLLVSELRRLSEEVLQGGRVIIVSHQEDVREEFAYRYRISKDANGYGQIECNQANNMN